MVLAIFWNGHFLYKNPSCYPFASPYQLSGELQSGVQDQERANLPVRTIKESLFLHNRGWENIRHRFSLLNMYDVFCRIVIVAWLLLHYQLISSCTCSRQWCTIWVILKEAEYILLSWSLDAIGCYISFSAYIENGRAEYLHLQNSRSMIRWI